MASAWVRPPRLTSKGERRYIVEYRTGGRESRVVHFGSYRTKALATIRAGFAESELAAGRIPKLSLLDSATVLAPTFAEAADRWLDSRLDVADRTRIQQRTSINRAIRELGNRRVDQISSHDVAAMVAAVTDAGAKPSYVRKVLQATAMLFDHAGITPNPARNKTVVKLPRDRSPEIAPPLADHVLAVHDLLPSRYRLPRARRDRHAPRRA